MRAGEDGDGAVLHVDGAPVARAGLREGRIREALVAALIVVLVEGQDQQAVVLLLRPLIVGVEIVAIRSEP
jgi:hypothetical protein